MRHHSAPVLASGPARDDLVLAADYLNNVFQHGDSPEWRLALRQLVNAHGGVPAMAERAKLPPMQVQSMLGGEGDNAELRCMAAVLHAMGLRLSVQPQ